MTTDVEVRSQSERFIAAREALNAQRLKLSTLGEEVTIEQGVVKAGFLAEMEKIVNVYGFSLLMILRDGSVFVLIEDTQPDREQGGVLGTGITNVMVEQRNVLFDRIFNFFNRESSLSRTKN